MIWFLASEQARHLAGPAIVAEGGLEISQQ